MTIFYTTLRIEYNLKSYPILQDLGNDSYKCNSIPSFDNTGILLYKTVDDLFADNDSLSKFHHIYRVTDYGNICKLKSEYKSPKWVTNEVTKIEEINYKELYLSDTTNDNYKLFYVLNETTKPTLEGFELLANVVYGRALATTKIEEYLDILVYSPDFITRRTIAKHTDNEKYLDILVNDYDEKVCDYVARKNKTKYLDILMNRPGYRTGVAEVAAKYNYENYLDILMADINKYEFNIREAIVKNTTNEKYLDIFVNDEDEFVRVDVVEKHIEKYLDILINDESEYVREHIAESGIKKYLDILVDDENSDVRYEVAKFNNEDILWKLVNDEDVYVRCQVAETACKYNLNKLVYRLCADKNKSVLKTIAKYGNDKHHEELYNRIRFISINSHEDYDDSVLKQIVKYTKNESLLKSIRLKRNYYTNLDVELALYDLKVKNLVEQLIK